MAPIQIFLSYARLDDEPPPDVDAKGFVTYLHEQLRYELQVLGQPQPKIWRDVRHVESGDQFDPVIGDALADSSLLLVVLSRNWPHRPYCVRELDAFAKRWRSEGEEGVKRRIVVVAKHFLKPEERPPLLQGQEGFEFYELDGDAGVGQEKEFFYRGQVRDARYEGRVRDLARYLWRTAERVGSSAPTSAAGVVIASTASPPAALPKSGRVIYLAKPATDMREAYFRLVEELQRRDYAIVPDPAADIPSDTSATAFVDEALAGAELSIHLLGEKSGYAPEEADPIVKLQLARAGARVPAAVPEGDAERAFRRIVWAPKVLEDRAVEEAPAARDPLAVLAKFDRHIPTDKVEGDTLSKFVDFLVQHLARAAPPRAVLPDEIKADARVYLYHSREDSDYVLNLAEALQERKIELIYPVFDGPPAEIAEFHHNSLVECDAVVMCWYQASEVWVRAQSSGWKDWHGLGRNERFAYRGLVAGPPPGDRKKFFVRLKRGDFDLVVDLTAPDQPLSQALDPLARIERPADT